MQYQSQIVENGTNPDGTKTFVNTTTHWDTAGDGASWLVDYDASTGAERGCSTFQFHMPNPQAYLLQPRYVNATKCRARGRDDVCHHWAGMVTGPLGLLPLDVYLTYDDAGRQFPWMWVMGRNRNTLCFDWACASPVADLTAGAFEIYFVHGADVASVPADCPRS